MRDAGEMGVGFALYVAERAAAEAVRIARTAGFELLHAGHVEAGKKRVVLEPIGVTFEGSSLKIRSSARADG